MRQPRLSKNLLALNNYARLATGLNRVVQRLEQVVGADSFQRASAAGLDVGNTEVPVNPGIVRRRTLSDNNERSPPTIGYSVPPRRLNEDIEIVCPRLVL